MLQARNHTLRESNEFIEIKETRDKQETNLCGFRVESFIGFQVFEGYRVVADATKNNEVKWVSVDSLFAYCVMDNSLEQFLMECINVALEAGNINATTVGRT